MVSSFGSERQKRAYAAAKRNKIESGALETALATAVAHAQTEVERASQGEEETVAGCTASHVQLGCAHTTGSDGSIMSESRFVPFHFPDSQLLQNSGLIPPHDPRAGTPQDVYDLNDSIRSRAPVWYSPRWSCTDMMHGWRRKLTCWVH